MWNLGKEQRRIALTGILSGLLFATQPLFAAPPGFDLELKEFKKPAAPLPVLRKTPPPMLEKAGAKPVAEKTVAKPSKPSKPATAKTIARKTAPAAKQIAATATPAPPLVAPPVTVATLPVAPPASTERLVILDAKTACPLASQMMDAVAQPVDPKELLHDVTLPAVAAARFEGIIAVLACELPRAEEYTYRRLLEMQGTQLIVLSGDDQLTKAVHAVADALGLSYQRLSGSTTSYLVRQPGNKSQMLRLTINKQK